MEEGNRKRSRVEEVKLKSILKRKRDGEELEGSKKKCRVRFEEEVIVEEFCADGERRPYVEKRDFNIKLPAVVFNKSIYAPRRLRYLKKI